MILRCWRGVRWVVEIHNGTEVFVPYRKERFDDGAAFTDKTTGNLVYVGGKWHTEEDLVHKGLLMKDNVVRGFGKDPVEVIKVLNPETGRWIALYNPFVGDPLMGRQSSFYQATAIATINQMLLQNRVNQVIPKDPSTSYNHGESYRSTIEILQGDKSVESTEEKPVTTADILQGRLPCGFFYIL